MNENGAAMVPAGTVARQGFDGMELARSADVGQAALTAAATAEVQARYLVALQRPRNDMDARRRMLDECRRPSFADVAIYRKPIGGGKTAEGMSIRFAEAAMRAWGNVYVSKVVVSDDDMTRTVRVTAVDLESNNAEAVDVRIDKTVERKMLKAGEQPLRTRINSRGELVYIVLADEGSLLVKQKAEVAKAKREVVMGLIPGDIVEDCRDQVRQTQRSRDAADPKAARKRLCDAFAEIGVSAANLEEFLGHALDGASPAEMDELRGVFVLVREGGATWPEVVQTKAGGSGGDDKKAEALRQKIAAKTTEQRKKGARGAPPPPAAAPAPPSEPGPIDGELEEDPEPGSDG